VVLTFDEKAWEQKYLLIFHFHESQIFFSVGWERERISINHSHASTDPSQNQLFMEKKHFFRERKKL